MNHVEDEESDDTYEPPTVHMLEVMMVHEPMQGLITLFTPKAPHTPLLTLHEDALNSFLSDDVLELLDEEMEVDDVISDG